MPAPPLGSRGFFPLSSISVRNSEDIEGMMSHGRENYVGFEVEHFAITEHTPERVVVETSSPSKHRFIDLRLTYTFTPEGVTIDRLLPLRPDATHLSQIC